MLHYSMYEVLAFPQFTRHFLTAQFDGYPSLDRLYKIEYTHASETRQTIFTMPVVTAITVQKSTVFPA